MRSRYQGRYIDRYIHLFMYNIIALLLMRGDSLPCPQKQQGVSRRGNQIMP